jgi:membrane protein implicated in regulation of membrane protease activity
VESLVIPAWLIWLMVAVALVLADLTLLGTQFILVATGVAALLAAGMAALGFGLTGQTWTFVLGTAVLVPLMIRLFRTRFARRETAPRDPGWERGARVTVVAQGDRLVAKLKSDHFPVRLSDGSQPVAGEELIVERMEGITLIAHRPDAG